MTPGLVIAAASSGTGKTTLMLGLLAALRARGVRVQPLKCGPDYIDPAFHTAAAGRSSVNLDAWAMSPAQIATLADRPTDLPADLFVTEGSMGLFDGVAVPGETGIGASADIAALMGWPVILVIDASGQAQTAAAVALGLAQFRADVTVAGVVLNKIASPRHEQLVRRGFESIALPVLGVLPRTAGIELPSRHLGLVQAQETGDLQRLLNHAGEIVAEHCDLDALMACAGAKEIPFAPYTPAPPPGQRIALARDAAFSFVYPHLIEAWRTAGASILPFSPLADEAPDPHADICWLPGGYPELHAGRLSGNRTFMEGVRRFAQTRPMHGECGGYMALGAGIVDAEGHRHEMLGLLGLETSFAKRKMHLGYRRAELMAGMPGFAEGHALRGHEFHYAGILKQPDAPLARVVDPNGTAVPETGSIRVMPDGGQVTGTFFHLIAEATR
ncbi:cobyrinate a,c-diamide synthase [Celeribacter neptunius]|uniref:Hydrogenobyrinate a,c-diamide synthase n=1 Tax=Celeribacter neptunius TaxID=588602 RepID=A0A1I3PR25_9RHOB|nr:cobyrinate a,c-diamide synthase [Celeribacter neptunius]SFJ23923.1 hydrogenobyrinic acid a,c-diamide synthase (glutamine-hydrolysing) [Celeribacter neptunius]